MFISMTCIYSYSPGYYRESSSGRGRGRGRPKKRSLGSVPSVDGQTGASAAAAAALDSHGIHAGI